MSIPPDPPERLRAAREELAAQPRSAAGQLRLLRALVEAGEFNEARRRGSALARAGANSPRLLEEVAKILAAGSGHELTEGGPARTPGGVERPRETTPPAGATASQESAAAESAERGRAGRAGASRGRSRLGAGLLVLVLGVGLSLSLAGGGGETPGPDGRTAEPGAGSTGMLGAGELDGVELMVAEDPEGRAREIAEHKALESCAERALPGSFGEGQESVLLSDADQKVHARSSVVEVSVEQAQAHRESVGSAEYLGCLREVVGAASSARSFTQPCPDRCAITTLVTKSATGSSVVIEELVVWSEPAGSGTVRESRLRLTVRGEQGEQSTLAAASALREQAREVLSR